MFESHAHLDFPEFDGVREQLFADMAQAGITHALIPGVSPVYWQRQLAVAKQYDCYFALGIHPWYIPEDIENSIKLLEQQIIENIQNSHFVAIGECGLDKLHTSFDSQLFLLEKQLRLAQKYNLPVILHAVKCHSELINLLKKYPNKRGGIIHGFYASTEIALQYINLGYKLGIGGLILNSQAKKLHQVVAHIGTEHLLIETDSPSMAPFKSAQKINSPLILPLIIKKLAILNKKTTVSILEQLNKNILQLFEL
ncbi:TatD family hydrolase [Shewanella aestuarii]|uniref:TatD family hydrolase n=1 Tax=Shewanella aestuarii TaxID=1028752 RepID=A0A6G9QQL9_9GAMM|nr:TatD family hydrolase [Shewanella aestuarii]QIR16109.1 TatD family hydrolase [Shewanella aestuarii]